MKYTLGIVCLIMCVVFYFFPELIDKDATMRIYGTIFLQLAILHFNKKDDKNE